MSAPTPPHVDAWQHSSGFPEGLALGVLEQALEDCERDARVALMRNQPRKYLEAIQDNAQAALDAAKS